MKSFSKAVVCLLLVALFLASGAAWCRTPIRDGDPGTIGACLAQPDGSTITLPCEEIYKAGRSGRSFAVKEFGEPQPTRPRLAVVSRRPLPVSTYWACDLTGTLSSISRVAADGSTINQRVLVVSPENVLIYCDQKGRPFLFPPMKGLGIEWRYKRSLTDISSDSRNATASVSTLVEAPLPLMPDALDSSSDPVYCATIADAKAQPDGTAVELQYRPVGSTGSGYFMAWRRRFLRHVEELLYWGCNHELPCCACHRNRPD